MKWLLTIALAGIATVGFADDKKGTVVEVAGLKSTTPATWEKKDLPAGSMRKDQFTLPKADGDKEDGDLAIFYFAGGAGTIEQNLQRQRDKFLPAEGKDKLEEKLGKINVGTIEATYQDVRGIYKKKPFPMAEKFTPMKDYGQLYVVFQTKDGQYYMNLLGPTKTVDKHKKDFEGWLKNFK